MRSRTALLVSVARGVTRCGVLSHQQVGALPSIALNLMLASFWRDVAPGETPVIVRIAEFDDGALTAPLRAICAH